MNWTACKKCNRVLWEKDADEDGLCIDCRPVKIAEETIERPKKSAKKDKWQNFS